MHVSRLMNKINLRKSRALFEFFTQVRDVSTNTAPLHGESDFVYGFLKTWKLYSIWSSVKTINKVASIYSRKNAVPLDMVKRLP